MRYDGVIEIEPTLFEDHWIVRDRYRDEAGELVIDSYDCGSQEELIDVLCGLDVLDCEGCRGA